MPIAYEQIPPGTLLPLFYAEVTQAQEPAASNLKLCLIGHANKVGFSEGEGLLDMPYLLSRDDASTLFGRGSMLESMYNRARSNARWTEIWGIAIPEAVASVQAAGTITVSIDATTSLNGFVQFHIAGIPISMVIRSTETMAAIATRLAGIINRTVTPVKAVAAGAVVTLTAKWAGVTGNGIVLSYVGPLGRRDSNTPKMRLTRRFFAFTVMAGGDGESDVSATFASLANRPFDVFAFPFTSVLTQNQCQTFMDGQAGRWSPYSQKYGHMVSAKIGSLASLTAYGDTRDDPHMTTMGLWQSILPSWDWAASLAALMVTHWAVPPELSRPLQTLELRGMYVGADDDQSFSPEERQLLLESGISTFSVSDDGTCHIDRVRTLRKTNAYGDPDPSWADAITMFQAMYFARQMRRTITGAFPRAALTNDDLGITGYASPGLIKLVIMHEYKRLQALGLVENYDLFVQSLIVERDLTDRGRVNTMLRPDFVNQLRIVAAVIETHLELDASDPLISVAA